MEQRGHFGNYVTVPAPRSSVVSAKTDTDRFYFVHTRKQGVRINISCGFFSSTRILGLGIPFSNRKKFLLLLILHVSSAKKHKITQCKAWR